MLGLLCLYVLNKIVGGTPTINLPINAQVPPVARTGRPFHFTFSASTFTSTADAIRYTLSKAPDWLTLDGLSRTFSGIPTFEKSGSIVVDLIADDGTGAVTMPVTLVTISSEPGPELGLSMADQLPAYGAFSSPSSILLSPASRLSLYLSSNTFKNTNSDTVYYAISADNTPLPSWLHFDPFGLAFSGTTPQIDSLANTSQSFGVELTASNVIGFADATTSFQIVVESHLLSFKENVKLLRITTGMPFKDSTLLSMLSSNGRQASSSDIRQTVATVPSWLSLDPQTLMISGTPPKEFSSQNFSITVSDYYGDSTTMMVVLQSTISPVLYLLNPLGVANATAGSDFVYNLHQTLNASNLELVVNLGSASAWLDYDKAAQSIKGHVPNNLPPQQVVVNITAREGAKSQSEILTIAIQNNTSSGLVKSINSGPTMIANPSTNHIEGHRGAQRIWLPAAIILPLATLIGSAVCLAFYWRKRRWRQQQAYLNDESSTSSRIISRPIVREKDLRRTKIFMSGALGSQSASSRFSIVPKLPRTWTSAVGKRHSKNRASNLSLGYRDRSSASWETYAESLIRPEGRTLHDSNRAKGEIGITSVDSLACRADNGSPEDPNQPAVSISSALLKPRFASKVERSNNSLAAFHGPNMCGFGHGKPDPKVVTSSMMLSSRGGRHSKDSLERRWQGFGTIKHSWRNNNNEWSGDSFESSDKSSSLNLVLDTKRQRRRHETIRQVLPSAALSTRSKDHEVVTLPQSQTLEEASRLRRSTNPFFSVNTSQHEQLRQSSSQFFSPPIWSRASPSKTESLYPRVIEYPKQVLSADNCRFESPSLSRTQSMFEYESDKDSEDLFKWPRRFPDPLRVNPVDRDDVQSGPSAAEFAREGVGRPWEDLTKKINRRLEELKSTRNDEEALQQSHEASTSLENDSLADEDATMAGQSELSVRVRSTPRGQRLGRQMGLREDDPGNRSMRGEIKRSGSSSFI